MNRMWLNLTVNLSLSERLKMLSSRHGTRLICAKLKAMMLLRGSVERLK